VSPHDSTRRGRLQGKVAIVTGAARGVGRSVALAFAREGAIVVAADAGVNLDGTAPSRSPVEALVAELARSGLEAHASFTDVTDRGQVQAVVDDTLNAYGRLDILVNAAAVMRHGSILDASAADWDAQILVNATGTFNTTQAAAAHWKHAGSGGRLINFGSDAGLFGVESEVAYAASKAAVIALTLSCAETMKDHGVTCNIVHPQAATRLTASIPVERLPDSKRWATGEFDPDHVPPALVYMASDAGRWINGCVLATFGYEVHLYRLAERARSIYSVGPWDQSVLDERLEEAFAPMVRR